MGGGAGISDGFLNGLGLSRPAVKRQPFFPTKRERVDITDRGGAGRVIGNGDVLAVFYRLVHLLGRPAAARHIGGDFAAEVNAFGGGIGLGGFAKRQARHHRQLMQRDIGEQAKRALAQR